MRHISVRIGITTLFCLSRRTNQHALPDLILRDSSLLHSLSLFRSVLSSIIFLYFCLPHLFLLELCHASCSALYVRISRSTLLFILSPCALSLLYASMTVLCKGKHRARSGGDSEGGGGRGGGGGGGVLTKSARRHNKPNGR